MNEHILPELFYAPRGLVTIVLFYSIPEAIKFDGFSDNILFFVVLVTTVIMMIGSIFFTPHDATRKGEEERGRFSEMVHHLARRAESLHNPVEAGATMEESEDANEKSSSST